jgi:hypothetical protein
MFVKAMAEMADKGVKCGGFLGQAAGRARRPRPRCASMARSNTASMSCSVVVVLASKYTTTQYQPGGKARTSAT